MANTEIRLPPKWIDLNITRRECGAFIASSEDDSICQCGRKKLEHGEVKSLHRSDNWNPAIHTKALPTNAFGTIVFEGEHYPNKARFVRLSYDTNPELVIELMTRVWGLSLPKLLITVQGSGSNFELSPRIGKVLQVGLVKAAKSCNAWIFTGGLNSGVTKHIGTAVNYERTFGTRKGGSSGVVSVGIANWGIIEHREELTIKNKDKIYNPLEYAQSKFKHLNPKHNNFLLVDNGSVGKLGGETYFRKRLEKCIARLPTGPNRGCDIPVVCVVIEGGLFTLRTVGDYLNDEPPTPVLIFAGTGRTADLIAWVIKRVQLLPSDSDIGELKDEVFSIMSKMYHVNALQCGVLFTEVKRIVARKNLLTVFNMHTNDEDFDSVLLGSIFRSQHWSPLQQLSLALAWDRVDLAASEVFVYGREWSAEHLEAAMMEALISNRLEFVSFLLEHGLNMIKFLTLSRLETLYNSEHSTALKILLLDISKHKTPTTRRGGVRHGGTRLTIHDVGVAISHMMGHIYKSNYIHMVSNAKATLSNVGISINGEDETEKGINLLHPFDDLFVWAILTKRQNMAHLFWRHGQGALVKALVAIKLNKFIGNQLIEKSNANLAIDFLNYASEWETLSHELVNSCFKADQKLARQLLTMELDRWSNMTNLQLAVMANHRMLLGHPCCQILLADLWMGALNIKSHPTLKVILGIFCPFFVFWLDYKSTEELKLLPHQERLHHSDVDEYGEPIIAESVSVGSRQKSTATIFGITFRRRKHNVKQEDIANAQAIIAKKHGKMKYHTASIDESDSKSENDSSTRIVVEPSLLPSAQTSLPIFYKNDSHQRQRSSFVTTNRLLPSWKKFYEFQKAPITNFYRHAFSYLVFACLLGWLILVPQDQGQMGIIEIYIIAYLSALGTECFRDFLSIDALNWSHKLTEFKSHIWQIADFCAVAVFMIAVALRNIREYFEYGMLIYRVSSIYWNLRLYKYMGVHRFIGPKIVMMSKMLKHMAYFAVIILVVIMSFGMAREAIRFPDVQPTWRNMAEAFLEPYAMMFGEVDTDSLSPQCGDGNLATCPVGFWIVPLTWAVYMMVANILIVNVLIAVFNGIYSEIDAVSLEVWMFQRFNFVMEFEDKPLLPPPFMIVCHIYKVISWMFHKAKFCLCEQELEGQLDDEEGPKIIIGNDHRLKTFLTLAEATIINDFEEENLATLVNIKLNMDGDGGFISEDFTRDYTGTRFQRLETTSFSENYKDRQGIQQLKANFHELTFELESHREKLDKLLAYWEEETENRESESRNISETSLRTSIRKAQT